MIALPLLALFLPGTSALDNGVGRTPIMGFDAWCAPSLPPGHPTHGAQDGAARRAGAAGR